MLFTDGLVETSERDIAEGMDRLTGEADRYVSTGFVGRGLAPDRGGGEGRQRRQGAAPDQAGGVRPGGPGCSGARPGTRARRGGALCFPVAETAVLAAHARPNSTNTLGQVACWPDPYLGDPSPGNNQRGVGGTIVTVGVWAARSRAGKADRPRVCDQLWPSHCQWCCCWRSSSWCSSGAARSRPVRPSSRYCSASSWPRRAWPPRSSIPELDSGFDQPDQVLGTTAVCGPRPRKARRPARRERPPGPRGPERREPVPRVAVPALTW